MSADARVAPVRRAGTAVDPAVRVPFSFEGAAMEGIAGDTVASALAANGVHLVRRRSGAVQRHGFAGTGAAEVALVAVGEGAGAVADLRAEDVDLVGGMAIRRQGARTALGRAFGVASGLLRAFLPGSSDATTGHGERKQLEVDVAVVGGGLAGLAAALTAAEAGANVLLAEATPRLGGWLLSAPDTLVDGAPAETFIISADIALARHGATVLTRTAAVRSGTGDGLLLRQRTGDSEEWLWDVRAREVVLATGPAERTIPFRGNDRPGVMLASTAVTLARRYGAAPGRRAVVLMADDVGTAAAATLAEAGVEIAATLDVRRGDAIDGTEGRTALSAVHVRRRGGRRERIPCDLLVVAGGLEAAAPRFARSARLIPGGAPSDGSPARAAGGAAGHFGIDEALADGTRAGAEAARSLGLAPTAGALSGDPAARISALLAVVGRAAPVGASGDGDLAGARTTPIHDWHHAHGAVFERAGEWLRPIAYRRDGETIAAAIVREATALRQSAGVVDASPLGKIEIRGPGARAFLDAVADTATAGLTPGGSRRVVLSADDGAVIDDGVLACLSDDHFHLTAANGDAAVLDHLKRRLGAGTLSVFLTPVTEAWAVARLCGPAANDVLSRLVDTVPHVPLAGFAAARIDSVPVRLFRRFVPGAAWADGWDVNIPAPFALSAWERIVAAGATPCGAAAEQRLQARGRFRLSAMPGDAGAPRAVPTTGDGAPSLPRRTPMLRRFPAADLVHDAGGVRMWTVDVAPIGLRVEPREAQAVEQAIGVPLPDPHRSVVAEPRHGPSRGSEVMLLGRGAGDWLILAAPDRAAAIAAELEAALAATHRQVADLSGALVVFALTGDVEPRLAAAMASTLPTPAPGGVAELTIADTPALLHWRTGARADLVVRASSARHVAARLAAVEGEPG